MNDIFKKNDLKLISLKKLEKLCKFATKSKNKRFRISLHNSPKELIQESIIIASGFSYIPPHKHPYNKTESYHIIKGQLDIYLLSDKGKVKKKIILRKSKKFITIAKFSPKQNSKLSDIKDYCNNLCKINVDKLVG